MFVDVHLWGPPRPPILNAMKNGIISNIVITIF